MPGPDGARGRCRRWFLGGLVGGGFAGSLATWLVRQSAGPPPQPAEVAATPFPELDHATFMRRAIAQAQEVPLLPFGAVLVRGATGQVLAEGHNRTAASPTFHGEIDVINRLAADQTKVDWDSLVLYTTAEPCPMCQSAIAWAGIPWVVSRLARCSPPWRHLPADAGGRVPHRFAPHDDAQGRHPPPAVHPAHNGRYGMSRPKLSRLPVPLIFALAFCPSRCKQ